MTKLIREIRIEGNVAFVPLTQGYEAVIDADDVSVVAGWNWFSKIAYRADGSLRTVYAARQDNGRCVRMHRVILDVADQTEVDHRDGDGLNNRKANLRTASKPENQFNSKTPCNNTSGHKGVYFHKSTGKWESSIRSRGARLYLGLFPTAEEAATAYAKASKEAHGEFGRLA